MVLESAIIPRTSLNRIALNHEDWALIFADLDTFDTNFDNSVQVINLAKARKIKTGDNQHPFVIPVPEAGWTLFEIRGSLLIAGTALTIQVQEFDASGVSQGDVIDGSLVFGSSRFATTTSFNTDRTTPGKDFFYGFDVDTSTSNPEDLTLQLRFRPF